MFKYTWLQGSSPSEKEVLMNQELLARQKAAFDELRKLEDEEGPSNPEELRQEMMLLIDRLHAQGFTVSSHLLAVPVMLEGTLPTNELFILRCRGNKCTLTVAGKTVARTTKLDGTPFEEWEAGHLAAHGAADIFAHLLDEAGYADAAQRVRSVLA